jgi:hypothetical protein
MMARTRIEWGIHLSVLYLHDIIRKCAIEHEISNVRRVEAPEPKVFEDKSTLDHDCKRRRGRGRCEHGGKQAEYRSSDRPRSSL